MSIDNHFLILIKFPRNRFGKSSKYNSQESKYQKVERNSQNSRRTVLELKAHS